MTTNKPLKDYLIKCKVPSSYEGHHLYHSSVIPGDKISSLKNRAGTYGSDHHDIVYAFHIIEPREVFLKWSNDKYENDYDIFKCYLPWQIINYSFYRPLNNDYFRQKFDTSLLFSYKNILESTNFQNYSIRRKTLFPAFLPNISVAGKICLGDVSEVIDYNLKFKFDKNSRSEKFESDFFKESVKTVDAFFTNMFNSDYPNFEDFAFGELGQEEDPSDVDELYYDSYIDWEFGHYYPINISEKKINTQRYLLEKKNLRLPSYRKTWDRINLILPWQVLF